MFFGNIFGSFASQNIWKLSSNLQTILEENDYTKSDFICNEKRLKLFKPSR